MALPCPCPRFVPGRCRELQAVFCRLPWAVGPRLFAHSPGVAAGARGLRAGGCPRGRRGGSGPPSGPRSGAWRPRPFSGLPGAGPPLRPPRWPGLWPRPLSGPRPPPWGPGGRFSGPWPFPSRVRLSPLVRCPRAGGPLRARCRGFGPGASCRGPPGRLSRPLPSRGAPGFRRGGCRFPPAGVWRGLGSRARLARLRSRRRAPLLTQARLFSPPPVPLRGSALPPAASPPRWVALLAPLSAGPPGRFAAPGAALRPRLTVPKL